MTERNQMARASRARSKSSRGKDVRTATRPEPLTVARARFALEAARSASLLEGERTHVVSARLTERLVAAAKARTGISSDTKLVELALASLAAGDDFGEWLVGQRGRLKVDFEIDL
jgi:hypothetical protein